MDSLVQALQSAMQLGWHGRPALPEPWLQQLWLYAGWALVLAWLLSALVQVVRWQWAAARPWQRVWACTLASLAVAALPGAVSPVYWWGLAFQYPSVLLVLWCSADLLWQGVSAKWGDGGGDVGSEQHSQAMGYAAYAVASVLGGILLLDSFAMWPVSVYAWGVGSAAVAWVLLGVALCWIVWGSQRMVVLLGLAVLVFIALRLPTGNVWDAMLDPWLCLALLWLLLRALWRRVKRKSV